MCMTFAGHLRDLRLKFVCSPPPSRMTAYDAVFAASISCPALGAIDW